VCLEGLGQLKNVKFAFYHSAHICRRRMCGTRVRVEMSSGRSRRGGGGGGGGRRGSAPTRYSRCVQSVYHKGAREIFISWNIFSA
jgi:hypothetical protein